MCLIVASEFGKLPELESMDNALENNPDGWGIVSRRSDGLHVVKGLKASEFYPALEHCKDLPYVAHLRFGTHGNVSVDNCHPFKVNRRLYMAHNGVLNVDTPNKKRSDTWHFVENVLKPVIRGTENIIPLIGELETWIGKGNKLAFLDSKGRINIANEAAGSWDNGIWYSNLYSLQSPWAWDDDMPSIKGGLDSYGLLEDGDRCDYCWSEKAVYYTPERYEICEACYAVETAYEQYLMERTEELKA